MAEGSDGLITSITDFDIVLVGIAINKKYVAACTDSLSRLFNFAGDVVHTFKHSAKTKSVAMSDRHAAFGLKHGIAEVWELKKRTLVCKLQGPEKTLSIRMVRISGSYVLVSAGRPIATTIIDEKRLQFAYLFCIEDGSLERTLDHGKAIGPQGISLTDMHAVTSGEDLVIKLWLISSGELLWTVPAPSTLISAVVLTSSHLLATGSTTVSALSLSDASEQHQLELAASQSCDWAHLATDGSFLVLSNRARQATVWTLADGKRLCSISDNSGRRADFGADVWGSHLVLRVGKEVRIHDLSVHAGYRKALSESLGMSLFYLIDEAGLQKAVTNSTGIEDPTFHELAPAMAYGQMSLTASHICPRDGRPGCALVDVLPSGPATHFMSWVWSYRVSVMVKALQTWVEDQGVDVGSTFIWVCFFCNNQERILNEQSKEGSDDLERTFEARLRQIGQVLVLLDDWSKPRYLSRIWCIFETFQAFRLELPYTLILPPNAAKTLDEALQRGMHLEVTREWQSIDVANAEASRPQDATKVKELILRTASFDDVNSLVKSRLVDWFKKQFEHFVERGVSGVRIEDIQCRICANKDDEIAALKLALAERDAELLKLRAILRDLPVGAGAAAVRSAAK